MIEDFQRGEVDTYVRHIKAGVEALSQVAECLLVFSGWVSSPPPPPLYHLLVPLLMNP